MLSEIMQDYKLLSIAEQIVLNKDDYKVILLSGPSSSGKTTSAMKLSLYLRSLGLNPTHLSLDDYFLERSETPLGPNGKPDFESHNAIDVKLFDRPPRPPPPGPPPPPPPQKTEKKSN